MKLELAANGGPSQLSDCLQQPENIFKKAIKDSYDERTHKLKKKLTTSQVKHLSSLFQPTPKLHSSDKPLFQGSEPVPIPATMSSFMLIKLQMKDDDRMQKCFFQ
ncbi:uncharacterized protein LOC111397095 [Olea europaea var. sylvestris]|uniref:uncharacterized protein LOC111397095 n=1 Tax=Olea europaea var. sylvestris TaxID=158386 RepID=UPI000C1D3BF1|nr:uncharacterized protein LOC111397095 [Olea europaea var. sylvestris]